MEESTDCSMNGDRLSVSASSDQESGWTFYFDHFLASQNAPGSSMATASMASDASSHAGVVAERSLKKRTAVMASSMEDDCLEDTACSAVSRLEVGGMEEGGRGLCKEMGFGSEKFTELKKRGMCLIPLSMIADFISK